MVDFSAGTVLAMVSSVYMLILQFIGWYIGGEVSSLSFFRNMIVFMGGIILFLISTQILLVVSWEGISVISFLLIGFWMRSDANSSSVSAVIYNRAGDFALIAMVLGSSLNWLWILVAILGNSALWIMGYWLPIAMESPTPVSSLLHSSTMVVASVTLGMLFSNVSIVGYTSVILICLFLSSWFDANNMIAFSTSVHLSIMILSLSCGMYGLVLFHIFTHAFVNASCFVSSGIVIAWQSGQDLRMWGLNCEFLVMGTCFLILTGFSGSLVYNSNEMIVLEMISVFIVVLGWWYSNVFLSNVTGYGNGFSIMTSSLLLLLVLSGSSYADVESLSLLMWLVVLQPVINSWSSYIANN